MNSWSISRFLLRVHSPWIHSWFFILFKGGKYRIDGRQLRTVSLGKPGIPVSDPNHNISPVCFVKIYHSSAPSMDSNLRCGLLDHTILWIIKSYGKLHPGLLSNFQCVTHFIVRQHVYAWSLFHMYWLDHFLCCPENWWHTLYYEWWPPQGG